MAVPATAGEHGDGSTPTTASGSKRPSGVLAMARGSAVVDRLGRGVGTRDPVYVLTDNRLLRRELFWAVAFMSRES